MTLGPDDWLAEVLSPFEGRKVPGPLIDLLLQMHSEGYSIDYARDYLDMSTIYEVGKRIHDYHKNMVQEVK